MSHNMSAQHQTQSLHAIVTQILIVSFDNSQPNMLVFELLVLSEGRSDTDLIYTGKNME